MALCEPSQVTAKPVPSSELPCFVITDDLCLVFTNDGGFVLYDSEDN